MCGDDVVKYDTLGKPAGHSGVYVNTFNCASKLGKLLVMIEIVCIYLGLTIRKSYILR